MCCEDKKTIDDEYDDDCYFFDIIEKRIFDIEFDEHDFEEQLAQAWTPNDEGYYKCDSDSYREREFRAYPTRYRLQDFALTKSLRRTLNRNRDLKTIIRPFRPTESKDDLYSAHLRARFQKDKPRYTIRRHFDYLKYAPVREMEVCVFDRRKLVACSLFFVSERSVVGSIGFWDTASDAKRGLGIFTVLLEMQYARRLGKEFYYLGNYIRQNPSYQYKTRFPALELWDWDNDAWVDFTDARTLEMFRHKFRCKDDLDKDPKFTVYLFENATRCTTDVVASALVGSLARGDKGEDSHYDLIILTNETEKYFANDSWANRFHRWRASETETRGSFKTLRAFYKNGDVYEFNFASPEWAAVNPIDEGTRRVVAGGMKILYDPHGVLEKLQRAILSEQNSNGKN